MTPSPHEPRAARTASNAKNDVLPILPEGVASTQNLAQFRKRANKFLSLFGATNDKFDSKFC